MNSLIFIKHVPVVWIEKKCKLIFISDDQYKYFIPIISNVIMMCYDSSGFIFKTSFRFTFVFRKDTHIMNISCSGIKIGFNIQCDIKEDIHITGTLFITILHNYCLGLAVSTLCNTITVTTATDSSHTNA